MTLNEAYRLGQENMRRRIEKGWRGWKTDTLGGDFYRVKKKIGNVPLLIRHRHRVRDLPGETDA